MIWWTSTARQQATTQALAEGDILAYQSHWTSAEDSVVQIFVQVLQAVGNNQ